MHAGEMLDKLVGTLPPPKDMETVDESDKPLAVAIVGRPNVGESVAGVFWWGNAHCMCG
jgi:predicted GTPase